MKRVQRTVALLLALLTLLAALAVPASAAGYKVETLKTGTWYKLVTDYKLKTIYKLKLTADSIVTVNWKGNDVSASSISVGFYDGKACKNDLYFAETGLSASGTENIALSKGTYYIRMCDYLEKPASRVKFAVQKAVNKANYTRAKAIALKAGQTVKIAQTADYCYSRWYKITVPKKKTVTVTTNVGRGSDINLFDAKMHQIKCATGEKKVITEDKVAKGTYFIRVLSPRYFYDHSEYVGTYISVKWN